MEIISYSLLFVTLYFEIFLLVSFLEKQAERPGTHAHARSPARLQSVCIIVPCYNEENSIASTLESLLALHYPADKLEIIVVDDGSTDRTLFLAQQLEKTAPAYGRKLRVFTKANGGKHTAMNFALLRTTADLIGCLDADSIVHSEALLRLTQVFENQEIAAVTPGIHVKKPENLLQHMQNAEYRLSVFNRFMLAKLGAVFITPGAFSIFRTKVVRELGGWRHGHSTEDMEMALRLQEAGYLIANAPTATVHTLAPRTVRDLFRQRVRWWYGWLRNAADYRFMIGNSRYGNLGLIVFPSALISIGAGIYFFARLVWYGARVLAHEIARIQVVGLPTHPSFDPFYLTTSALWFLIFTSVMLIFVLICVGSFIGTGRYRPPIGTPLFLIFYGFLAPLWLCAAVVRAVFKTGVRWR